MCNFHGQKVAFPAPKYCDTSPLERQKQIVSRNGAAGGTVFCKFRLVLVPKLRNDTKDYKETHPLNRLWTYLSL